MTIQARSLAVWRRNLIGAVVAAIAATVIIVTQLYPQWSDYRDTVVPEHVIAPRASLTAYGQTWQLGDIRHLNRIPGATKPELPRGTTLFVVIVDRSGTPTLSYCRGVLTDGKRGWRAQPLGQLAAALAEGAAGQCGQPGRLQFSFLLPSDAVPTAVDIIDFSGRILLRVML